jgi:hypothetical protein
VTSPGRVDAASAVCCPAAGGGTSPTCPVCGATVGRASTGRPAVYCGKPCRQAAHRARLAAARAAEAAGWFRRELAGPGYRGERSGVEDELARAASRLLGAFARVHDYPLPGKDTVCSGWEASVIKEADRVRRLASRACDLAEAHMRQAGEFAAATAMFRRAEASAPVGDETSRRFVAARAARHRATLPTAGDATS